MSIQATCPRCRSSFYFPDSTAGKRVRCFKCMAPLLVPGLPAEEEIPSVVEIEDVRRRIDEPEGLSTTAMTLIGLGALAALLVMAGGFLLWSHLKAIETANQLAAQVNNLPQIAIDPNGIRMPGIEVDVPIPQPGNLPVVVPPVQPPIFAPQVIEPLAPPADIPDALKRIQIEQGSRRQAALSWLAAQPVDPNQQAEVTQTLVALLKQNDISLREQAFKILEQWATAETVRALVGLLEDESFLQKDRVMDLLAKLKDGPGLTALAARLTERFNRGRASQALKKAGPAAEGAVLPYLSHAEHLVRLAAVDVLSAIGTQASVPALTRLAGSDQALKLRAQNAVRQIGKRK